MFGVKLFVFARYGNLVTYFPRCLLFTALTLGSAVDPPVQQHWETEEFGNLVEFHLPDLK
jgi:hypothetical protein